MNLPINCPLTGKPGELIRRRSASELAESYATYCGASLDPAIIEKYFVSEVTEYFLRSSGLRWYVPAKLGDGDFYAELARVYPWYYSPGSWDKVTALGLLAGAGSANVVEIGSGSGWLLAQLRDRGIASYGVEINAHEVESSRSQGLTVYFPDEIGSLELKCDWLCLLQTIEHVEDPAAFLGFYTRKLNPRYLIMSAPCFESLLGHTKDPLSWPPHHATAWSERAFRTLGSIVGYRVTKTLYTPLSFVDLQDRLKREGSRRLFRLPYIPKGRVGHLYFKLAQLIHCRWALRGHSVLVVMERSA
jgi:SAM-dependent methyltransferase